MSFIWLKTKIASHHLKVLNLLCCMAFSWQIFCIFKEWILPSQEITSATEVKLTDIELPILFKVCPDPGFNTTALREEGYAGIYEYFLGRSMFNTSLYGWAGHTNNSQTRGTVHNIYKKIRRFSQANAFIQK